MEGSGIDSKYSWLVAIASSMIFLLSAWPMRVGGQLFVSLLDESHASRKAASFPFSMAYLMRSASGPFAGYFSQKVGLHIVTLIGCLLCAVGMFGCFFAEDIVTLDICMGIIYGIGYGWSTAVIPEIISRHFDKHVSKANGVVFGGSGCGAFATPPLIALITKKFGISGTFLIMSAIILNGIPCALLLKDPKIKRKTSLKIISNATELQTVAEKVTDSSQHLSSTSVTSFSVCEENLKNSPNKKYFDTLNFQRSHSDTSKVNNKNKFNNSIDKSRNIVDDFNIPDALSDKNIKQEQIIEDETESTKVSSILFDPKSDLMLVKKTESNNSEKRRNSPQLLNIDKLEEDIVLNHRKTCSIESNQKNINAATETSTKSNSSLKILFSPLFLFMTIIQSSHCYVMYLSWTITVDVARDKGVKGDQEVFFVMGLALFDVIGRSFFGFLTDSGYVSCVNLCIISFACMGFSCLSLTWVSGFIATLTIVCILGLIVGINTTGLPGLINYFFQKEDRPMAMSSRLVMYAPMSFTMSPLIGYFREVLGSYDGLLYLCTSICAVCSIVLMFLFRIYERKS